MRLSALTTSGRLFALVTAASLAALAGCKSDPEGGMPAATGGRPGTGGARPGSGGTPGTGGSASTGGTPGSGGTPATGGAPGSGGTSDAAPTEVTSETPPAAGWAGVPGIEDLSTVKKSPGCGMDPGQMLGSWVRSMVTVPPPGPNRGTGNRVYFVKLPTNYDKNKAYRLIFVVPGCSGTGNNIFDFTDQAGAEGVIQIGLNPDPGSSRYPGLLCFDNERTDTVEFKFFEKLLEIADSKLCYDQHRVFFAGHSSGSFVSNDVGCVYGSKKVRAIAPSSGGLIILPDQAPPCSDLPIAGIWSHNEDDSGNLFVHTKNALNRALKVNRCQGNFDTSPRAPYPGHPTCEKFSSCPKEFPIVVCHPKTGGHEGNREVQPLRNWEFFKSF